MRGMVFSDVVKRNYNYYDDDVYDEIRFAIDESIVNITYLCCVSSSFTEIIAEEGILRILAWFGEVMVKRLLTVGLILLLNFAFCTAQSAGMYPHTDIPARPRRISLLPETRSTWLINFLKDAFILLTYIFYHQKIVFLHPK